MEQLLGLGKHARKNTWNPEIKYIILETLYWVRVHAKGNYQAWYLNHTWIALSDGWVHWILIFKSTLMLLFELLHVSLIYSTTLGCYYSNSVFNFIVTEEDTKQDYALVSKPAN